MTVKKSAVAGKVVKIQKEHAKGINALKDEILRQLVRNGFNMEAVLKKLGVPRGKFNDWIEEDPVYRHKWLAARACIVDLAEAVVFNELKSGGKGSLTAAFKILEMLGKDRGYSKRREVITGKAEDAAASRNRMMEALSTRLTGGELERLIALIEKLGGTSEGSGGPAGGSGRKTA